MPEYWVSRLEIARCYFRVEADTPEQALEELKQPGGFAEFDHHDWVGECDAPDYRVEPSPA